jgi:hypothetical protein
MNFAELVTEVILWTKRPDLVSATNSAIRRNTLKWHRKEKWARDLVTITGIANPTPGQAIAVIPIASNFPRFRQFASVRVDQNTRPLDALQLDDNYDLDGYARNNVYLVAGTNLNIKAAGGGFLTIDASYYQDPIAVSAGYSSWIADDYPDLIACGAAAEILAFDNESEIYKAAKASEAEQFTLLRANNLETEAR